MNKKETYEIIIAKKLEQLPVPALEDAIWNRISAQLDIDMPETPAQNPPTPPNNAFLNSVTLLVLLTALATWLFIHNYPPATPPPATPPPAGHQDSFYQQYPPPVVTPPPAPTPPKTRAPKTMTATPDTLKAATLAPILIPVTRDSLPSAPPELMASPPAAIMPPADVPAKKKPAGVPGLKDDDYKIAPKR